MKPFKSCASVGLVVLGLAACAPMDETSITYPEALRGDVVDVYFGDEVADPYRWFEDLDSDATASWVEAQNAVSFPYLETIPQREAIEKRLTTSAEADPDPGVMLIIAADTVVEVDGLTLRIEAE